MEDEIITLPSSNHNQSDSFSTSAAAADNTQCIVSSSSNFASFNLHITACSSPYSVSKTDGVNRENLIQRNGRNIFLADTLNGKNFKANKFSNSDVLLDKRLIVLLFVTASIIILYKMVIVTMPYATTESYVGLKMFAENSYRDVLMWANANNARSIVQSILCGLAIAIFGYALVYLDSNVPGISPPSPFTPRKKLHYYQQKSSIHLGFITAIAVGVIIGALMYLDN